MKRLGWNVLSIFAFVASMAVGCGSCEQATPPPSESQAPAAKAAAEAQPTATTRHAEMPTARTLPTVAEAPTKPPREEGEPGAAAVAPEPQGEADSEDLEDEADCTVIGDSDEDFGPPPLTIHFTVDYECTEDGATVSWDFGDGSPLSSEVSPTHTYNQVGEYVAIVTITTPDGLSSTDELDISVEREDDEGM